VEEGEARGRFTFVVRLVHDRAGGISGVLERVRTGEKARFTGLDGVAPALAAMLDRTADASTERHTPEDGGSHR
jgi:hypothetical protein